MFTTLHVTNYKCLVDEQLRLLAVTLVTGANSTGKSTLIQSILHAMTDVHPETTPLLPDFDFSFASVRNRNNNARELSVELDGPECRIRLHMDQSGKDSFSLKAPKLEENVYYLNANRLGFNTTETISPNYHVGTAGEYVMGSFEQEKSMPVAEPLRVVDSSQTLSAHVDYWLSYILDQSLELYTSRITPVMVQSYYKSEQLDNLPPRSLGVGISYLVKILITCLRATPGDLIMIENPEIHLHPAARARLAEFFAYVANAGIQLIIETHCEHLLNKFQHLVHICRIAAGDVMIYYKDSIAEPFEHISITPGGRYDRDFPEGFFDATLAELLEIN